MEALRTGWTVKSIAIIVTALILFHGRSLATNHSVGGVSGWDLTSDLQAWSSENTFHVGDSLVFSYTPVHDVVEVEADDYESCTSSNPITTHADGETVVPLTQPGARFFICGRRGHCQMGLKLRVQVTVDQTGTQNDSPPGPSVEPSIPEAPPGGVGCGFNASAPPRSYQPRSCHVRVGFFGFVVMAMAGSVFGVL